MEKVKELLKNDDIKTAAIVAGGFAALLLLVRAAAPRTLKLYIGGKKKAGFEMAPQKKRTMTKGGSKGKKFV